MLKRLTPQEKKRLSYERDHIRQPEYPKAFRKTWPFVKAQAKRYERHKVRQTLAFAAECGSEDQKADLALEPVRPERAKKRCEVNSIRAGFSISAIKESKAHALDLL